MANEHKIEINKRDDITPQGLKRLRREGNIPGVYYSSISKDSFPISITKNDYNEAIKSGARVFNISVSNKKQNVLFKSVQYHPVTEEVLHIDLYGIRMDQAITIKVTLQLIGDAIGVKEEGGIVNQPLNEVEIQCLPADIPDFIELDISELSIGDSLNASHIKLDEKFALITSEDSVAVSVTQPMKEIEPVVEIDEDEIFLDEDGEPIEGEEEKDAEKPAEDSGGDAPVDKEAGSK
jgi:large subunit ribosomal protein L25